MAGTKFLVLNVGDVEGANIRLGADVHRRAGFDPALVVEIVVPPKSAALELLGPFRMQSWGSWRDAIPERVEVLVLDTSPARPLASEASQTLEPRSASASTVYKLFFRLTAAQCAVFQIPTVRIGNGEVTLPQIALDTAERTQPVRISVMPTLVSTAE